MWFSPEYYVNQIEFFIYDSCYLCTNMQNESLPFNVDKGLSRDVAQKPDFPIKLINIYISITNLVSLPLHVLYN